MTRILQGDVLDGEFHLHPRSIERLQLDHGPVFNQVGLDEQAPTQRLQGVPNRTPEHHAVPLHDSWRPSKGNICWVKIGCKAEDNMSGGAERGRAGGWRSIPITRMGMMLRLEVAAVESGSSLMEKTQL